MVEKEELISALQARIKSVQKELKALYKEKRDKDIVYNIISASELSPEEVKTVLEE